MLTVARSDRLRDMVDNDILSQNNTCIVKEGKAKKNKSTSSVVDGEVREYVREDSLQQVYEMGWLPNPISNDEGNTKRLTMTSQYQAVQIVVMSMTERPKVGFAVESTSLPFCIFTRYL